MELIDYIRVVQKRWWIVVVAVVLTAGSAYAFSELQPPEYTSTAEVVINPARPDWGLAQSSQLLLRSYMTVANSYKWAKALIEDPEWQFPMTPEQLRSKVHFAAEIDRMTIKIEAEENDPTQANRIAKAWAQRLVEWRESQNNDQNKEDRVYAILRDEPRAAQSFPPSSTVMVAAGSVFGLVVAGVVIFFLEWMEATVVSGPRDLEQRLGLTVVGAIPESD